MKIKVIIPNSSIEFRDEQIQERKKAVGYDTEIDVICLPKGPESIESSADDVFAAPYVLDEIQRAEKEGYDAVTIDCAADVSIRAAKETACIPVTSGGEASLLFALALGDKFSVITVLPATAHSIKHNIRSYCLEDRLASVRSVNIPVLELHDTERLKKVLKKEIKKAIYQDGAEVIVLGCTGMSPVARALNQEFEKVPIIDPAVAAIKLAESLVQMGIMHSKLSFETPPKKRLRNFQKR